MRQYSTRMMQSSVVGNFEGPWRRNSSKARSSGYDPRKLDGAGGPTSEPRDVTVMVGRLIREGHRDRGEIRESGRG